MGQFGRVYPRHSKKHGVIWYMDYWYEGERYREKIDPPAKNVTEAKAALEKRRVELFSGKWHPQERKVKKVRFGKWEPKVWQERLAQGKDPMSFAEKYWRYAKTNFRSKAYWQASLHFLCDFFGDGPLVDITSWDVERYKAHRRQMEAGPGVPLAPRTVNIDLNTLKAMFNRAAEWGDLPKGHDNPVKTVKKLDEGAKETETLSEEMFSQVYEEAAPHLKPMFLAAITAGMRRGEILRLTWDCVDLDRDIIAVKTLKKNGEGERIRHIPIHPSLREALLGIRRVEGSPYVFCHCNGKPYKDIKNGVRAAFERAGVMVGKAKRVHYFRHTFATELVEREKVDPFTLQDLLGHSRIETTKRYTHPRPEYKRKVIEALPFAPSGTKVAQKDEGEKKVISFASRKAIASA